MTSANGCCTSSQKRAVAALHVAGAIEQAHAVGDGVEGLLPLSRELMRRLFGAARAQDGAHRGDELDGVDGQREVAVGARVERGADVVRADVGGRDVHDRDGDRLRVDAQPAQHLARRSCRAG